MGGRSDRQIDGWRVGERVSANVMKTWVRVIGGDGRVMVLFSHHSFELYSSFG